MALTVEQAERELRSLEDKLRELERLRERHAMLRNFVQLGRQLENEVKDTQVVRSVTIESNVPQRRGVPAERQTLMIAAAVLRERGEPLSIPEILPRMKEKGWAGSGHRKRDYKAVYAAVHRKSEIFENAGGKWKLREHFPRLFSAGNK